MVGRVQIYSTVKERQVRSQGVSGGAVNAAAEAWDSDRGDDDDDRQNYREFDKAEPSVRHRTSGTVLLHRPPACRGAVPITEGAVKPLGPYGGCAGKRTSRGGFEPPTCDLEDRCSVLLSYRDFTQGDAQCARRCGSLASAQAQSTRIPAL